jgi:LuxR family transcriptional regulator, maltose regulon positive regulatory protein
MSRISRQSNPSIAKITRPIASGALPRKRLFDRLDECLHRPVVWVSGPAGCGKTTLISSYLEARTLPCLWYQVDQGDTDLSTFFYYMGLAAKKAAPTRRPLPLLTPEYQLGLPTFTLRYFEKLCASLKPPCAIVLDNYERVPDDSTFHEMIRWGLDAIPEGITVIINSRRQSLPPFASLKAGEKLGSLGWEDIRFTRDESREIIQKKGHRTITEEVVGHIYEKTEGWAAGLILMIEATRSKSIDLSSLKGMTPEEVYSYFETELFDKTDPNTQTFLLKTAFLPETTAEMAASLTGMTQSEHILQSLSRSNFFIQSHAFDAPVYQYHSLFREYLISRATKTFPEEDLSSIKGKAATILAASHHYEESAHLCLEDNAWQEMANLILSHAQHLVAQGRFTTLQDWLDHLPPEIYSNNPWLLYWMGMSRLPFAPLSAKTYFEQAFEQFQNGNDTIGSLMAASGVVNAIAYGYEDFTLFDHWFPVLTGLAAHVESFPNDEIEALITAAIVMTSTLRENPCKEAEIWAQRAMALKETPVTINPKIHALYYIFWNKLVAAGPINSHQVLGELQRLSRSPHAHPMALILVCLANVLYYEFQGLHEETIGAVNKGLEFSRKTGIHIHDVWFYLQAAPSFLNRMDVKGARIWLDKLESVIDACPAWAKSGNYFQLALEARILGDLTRALFYAEKLLELDAKVGSRYSIGMIYSLLAQLLYEMGREKEAQYYHIESNTIASRFNFISLKISTALFEAQYAFDHSKEHKGKQFLSQAIKFSRETGFFFMQDFTMTAQICALALQHGIEVDYVREIIRRRHLTLDKPPLHIDQWPWPFMAYTLGRFELHQNGNALQFSRKAQKKPLEMLKALIAFGGKEIGEEQMADLLWPEADGDAAYSAFTTNLSRLRHLLGYDRAIRYQDGRITLDPHSCWVDAWAFEHMVSEADTSWKEDPTHTFVLARKAIDLYQGHFLASDGDPYWAVSYRESLRDKYLRLITRIGDHHKKTEQWEEALACFLKGIDVDPLVEEFYQQMMVCYEKLEQPSRAIETYHRCKKILASTLGCDPSPKTQTLYRSLRSGTGQI